MELGTFCTHIFKITVPTFLFMIWLIDSTKVKMVFYSDFSVCMQLYRLKQIKCLRTRKYSLEHKCQRNLSLLRLFLATVACYLNCPDTVALAHPFWALTTFPVCFSVLSCWTNRAPSTPSSSTSLHSCRVSVLLLHMSLLCGWASSTSSSIFSVTSCLAL
jgi:hypothetical protein